VTPLVVLVTEPLGQGARRRARLEHTERIIRSAAAALGPGGLLVQLRDKESSEAELALAARALRDVTRLARAVLVINGPAALALAVGADGVHLPSAAPSAGATLASCVAAARGLLGESALVTAATHDDDELRAAASSGATAALVSPIFTTPGKGPARGVAAIESARAIVDASRRTPALLVYALGGVTPENAGACCAAGADGVAVIRALYKPVGESGVRDAVLALSRAVARRP
jgi:thiamine-phosphate pyrophosphorylase